MRACVLRVLLIVATAFNVVAEIGRDNFGVSIRRRRTCPTSEAAVTLADFGCPAGDDPDTWIEGLGVVDEGSANWKTTPLINHSFTNTSGFHFHVPTNGDWVLKIFKQKNNNAIRYMKCDPSSGCCAEIKDDAQKKVPCTLQPMNKIHSLTSVIAKYNNGDYASTWNNGLVGADQEATYFWELDPTSQTCYAMAAYVVQKAALDNRFVTDGSSSFAKGFHIRILKFSVCKVVPVGNSPLAMHNKTKCASRKATVSCWLHLGGANYQKCNDVQAALAATTMARG
jgi:hypothetical protein